MEIHVEMGNVFQQDQQILFVNVQLAMMALIVLVFISLLIVILWDSITSSKFYK